MDSQSNYDERIITSEDRIKKLETKALIWLDHVLKHFDEKEGV